MFHVATADLLEELDRGPTRGSFVYQGGFPGDSVGRYVGRSSGVDWIAWPDSGEVVCSIKKWQTMCEAFDAARS